MIYLNYIIVFIINRFLYKPRKINFPCKIFMKIILKVIQIIIIIIYIHIYHSYSLIKKYVVLFCVVGCSVGCPSGSFESQPCNGFSDRICSGKFIKFL